MPRSEISGYVNFEYEIGRKGDGNGQFGGWLQFFCTNKESDTLYCCDTSNKRIQVFDLNKRTFKYSFPTYIKGKEFQARGIYCLRNGNLCVNAVGLDDDSSICIYTSEGRLISQFAKGKIGYPSAMVVDDMDCINIFNRRSSRISRWDKEGVRINDFDSGIRGDVLRMAADTRGRLIVPEHLGNKVTIFEPTGSRVISVCPQSNCEYSFRYPAGVACDDSDNFYVCDLGNNRISKFSNIGVHIVAALTKRHNQIYNPHDIFLTSSNQLIYSHVSAHYVKVFSFENVVQH